MTLTGEKPYRKFPWPETDFDGQEWHQSVDSFARRVIHEDEELLAVLSNKLKIHNYNAGSRNSALTKLMTKFFRLFASRAVRHVSSDNQKDNEIRLTGLELQHFHRLCGFDVPDDISLQDDYLMDDQVFAAWLERAERLAASPAG